MTKDELEFLTCQHFDGTLSAEEETRLQRLLAEDAAARMLFEEHEKLDAALVGSRSKIEVDEAWLTAAIADRIDEANSTPIRHPSWGWAAPMAMAACLLIGLTLGVIFLRDTDKRATPLAKDPTKALTVAVVGSTPTPAASHGYATISVGVPANLTPQIVAALYLSQDINASRVSIRAAGRRTSDFD